ncbi:hypothetical protein AAIB41_09705 [Brucella sp. BE17]|uniref:hypothetical protein n=1 Tax=Brucella sp. BE17 TaxID=3142977 RepID=UPI0031BAF767
MQKTSSVKKVLGIFAIAALVVAGFGLIGLAFIYGAYGVIFIDGVASIILLMIFSIVFWRTKIDWLKPEAAAIMISFFSFIGMCVDSRGNPIYNQPLVWLFGSNGSHLNIREIVSHGGGSTGVNYEFQIVNLYSAIERSISGWLVMPFRFVEYIVVLSLLVTLITVIRKRRGADWLPVNATDKGSTWLPDNTRK